MERVERVRNLWIGCVLSLAFVLAACATPPPVVVTLTVSPTAATVTIGVTTPVAFTATLTNSTETISWVLSGAGSLTASSGATTSYVPPATGVAGTATLTASAAGQSVSATITIEEPVPTTITVAGTVEDLVGQLQPGLVVRIGASATTTDASGAFSIADVTAPYDAIVVDAADSVGYIFEGLTRSDPTLQLFTLSLPSDVNSAGINSGNLSGGAGFPNPASHQTLVAFGSDEGFSPTAAFPSFLSAGQGPGFGPAIVQWWGLPTTVGALHALQSQVDGAGLPTDYTGYGTTPLVLGNGAVVDSPVTDIVLSNDVTEASLTGSIALPAGYTATLIALYSDFGTNQSLVLLGEALPSADFAYTTPDIADSTITTLVSAEEDGGLGVSGAFVTDSAPNASAVPLTVPAIPEQIAPAEAATAVTLATPFSWQPFPGGVHVVVFEVGTTTFVVTTTETEATIPDLTAEGLPLPAAASGSWLTVGIAPFDSVDAASGPGGYALDFFRGAFISSGLPAPEQSGSYGITVERTFTTP